MPGVVGVVVMAAEFSLLRLSMVSGCMKACALGDNTDEGEYPEQSYICVWNNMPLFIV